MLIVIGSQQLLPDVEQRCFDVVARPMRSLPFVPIRSGAGRRARSSLPLEVFGKCSMYHPDRWHHVVGQDPVKFCTQQFTIRIAVPRHHIGDEPFVARMVFSHHDRTIVDLRHSQ